MQSETPLRGTFTSIRSNLFEFNMHNLTSLLTIRDDILSWLSANSLNSSSNWESPLGDLTYKGWKNETMDQCKVVIRQNDCETHVKPMQRNNRLDQCVFVKLVSHGLIESEPHLVAVDEFSIHTPARVHLQFGCKQLWYHVEKEIRFHFTVVFKGVFCVVTIRNDHVFFTNSVMYVGRRTFRWQFETWMIDECCFRWTLHVDFRHDFLEIWFILVTDHHPPTFGSS